MPMKRFPKLRPCLWDAVAVLAVMVLAAVSAMSVWGGAPVGEELLVVVSVDGEEVTRKPLEQYQNGKWGMRIQGANDYLLEVTFEEKNGSLGVLVESSDCPTQDCVHTGTITRAGQSIVCLPARVVIQLEGGSGGNDVDMVVG